MEQFRFAAPLLVLGSVWGQDPRGGWRRSSSALWTRVGYGQAGGETSCTWYTWYTKLP